MYVLCVVNEENGCIYLIITRNVHGLLGSTDMGCLSLILILISRHVQAFIALISYEKGGKKPLNSVRLNIITAVTMIFNLLKS